MKVAELVMVMVPGSVEDERMFSTFKYIRDRQRNRLHAQHLRSCARGFKSSVFSVKSFHIHRPFWSGSALRSAVGLFRQSTQLEGQYWRQISLTVPDQPY